MLHVYNTKDRHIKTNSRDESVQEEEDKNMVGKRQCSQKVRLIFILKKAICCTTIKKESDVKLF